MRKSKEEKAITLIALIITIVVLLILAAVAISSITNDGILQYAQNAAKDYNQAVKNEQDMLQQYVDYLYGARGPWTQTGTTVTDGTGKVTLKVGDYINYISGVSGYTDEKGWQVIGVENGQVLLMSSKDVVSNYEFSGADDYLNGVSELNSLCADYGKGIYATGARSVNVEDINRVTGYKPETANYDSGNVYQYGNEVTYTLDDGKVAWRGTNGLEGKTPYTVFKMLDGRRLGTDIESATFKSDYYEYTGSTYLTDSSSDAYKLIFGNNSRYWLGSQYIRTYGDGAGFGLRSVEDSGIKGNIIYHAVLSTYRPRRGVRAVVSLELSVGLKSAGQNSWTLSK